jgi:mitogen-activated protein kinase kinase kinase 17/18
LKENIMAMAIGEWARGPAIGRGSSATVSLAFNRRTGAVFVVKSVDASRAGELRREQSILQSLSSPHVVRCLGLSGCDLFLEHADGGSLADEIKRRGGEERVIRRRARDVLLGLAHAHATGVAHCDVKARNVLLGADGRAMLADFGCARRVDGRGVGGGTPMFMAPEAARGEAQGAAADVWALGCTVVEMATGAAPWLPRFADPMAALRHVALSGEAPACPTWMSEDARDFLARCFRRDPRERWTAEQLLRHPFVAAATDDESNSAPIVAEKEPFVSPKSVLDRWSLWDDSTLTACFSSGAAPTERVRELAAGAPDWTWDANWITVHSYYEAGDATGHIYSSLAGTSTATVELEEDAAANSVGESWNAGYAISSFSGGDSTDCSVRGGNPVVTGCKYRSCSYKYVSPERSTFLFPLLLY